MCLRFISIYLDETESSAGLRWETKRAKAASRDGFMGNLIKTRQDTAEVVEKNGRETELWGLTWMRRSSSQI